MIKRIVRQVLPNEYHKYRDHLLALDKESRNLRFACPVSDEFIHKFCDDIEKNKDKHILFCIENAKLEFIGICHIATGNEMELAFSVLKKYQETGLGNMLMERAIRWCRTHNILTGYMLCVSTNGKMKHLCSKHGIEMQTEYGETTGSLKFDIPTLNTYINESIDNNLGMADYFFKRFTYKPWLS